MIELIFNPTKSVVDFKAVIVVRKNRQLKLSGSMEKAMKRKSQHVVARGDKWAVRKTGSDRVTRKIDTKEEAIEVARQFARKQKTDVYIHGRDGRIYERNCYGDDPFAPVG